MRRLFASSSMLGLVVAVNATGLQRDFQVHSPVRFLDSNGDAVHPSCEQLLVDHVFANSYGEPFVGTYTPPSCDFNRITWNLTVTSAGVQYDRLGFVSLGDIEVFRTSTAEPTDTGIIYTYIKDMSTYLNLFKDDQPLIFDLPNIIDAADGINATYNVTLTASYYKTDTTDTGFLPADEIFAISAGLTNATSTWELPADDASRLITLPRNTRRAIVSIAATGQSSEEEWFINLPDQDVDDFPGMSLPKYLPFREVQLFIDGTLAGVVWPFPIIFSGGFIPGAWAPVEGIDLFDLREDEIDITPWLPLLCDGKAHNFSIKVSGLNSSPNGPTELSEITNSYWVVDGKVFVWLDTEGRVTTGRTLPELNFPAPALSSTSHVTNNDTDLAVLTYAVDASRELEVRNTIRTSGGEQSVYWKQSLSYTSGARWSNDGNTQVNWQTTHGLDESSSGYQRTIIYPLNLSTTQTTSAADIYTLTGSISRGKSVSSLGPSVFPSGLESFQVSGTGWAEATTQTAAAIYVANETSNINLVSLGNNTQVYTYSGYTSERATPEELYYRDVVAIDDAVASDVIRIAGKSVTVPNHRYAPWSGSGRRGPYPPRTAVEGWAGR